MKQVWVALIMVGMFAAAAGAAQADEKLRIGVLDVRKILLESKSGQAHRAELEKMVKERREKIGKEEAGLKALQEKLEKDMLVMTDKQKEQKRKEFDDRVGALKKMSQDAQQEVAKRDNEISGKASAMVRDIVDEIAKQEKVALVVDKNQAGIVWVAEEVDLTDKVLKAYEAKTAK